jgi:hypothetical protein
MKSNVYCSKGHRIKGLRQDENPSQLTKLSATKSFAVRCVDPIQESKLCSQCNKVIPKSLLIFSCSPCQLNICEWCVPSLPKPQNRLPHLVFSAHGDTCFDETCCLHVPRSSGYLHFGEVDNFGGVSSMLNAYFSGQMPSERVRCNITYGEEQSINGVDFTGARELMSTLEPFDFVVVIDVTGVSPRRVEESTVVGASRVTGHVVFEKVLSNPNILSLLSQLSGQKISANGVPCQDPPPSTSPVTYTYETWDWCADPQAWQDETDAYREEIKNVVFLGLPTTGGYIDEEYQSSGDYNAGPVFLWKRDMEALAVVVVELSRAFIAMQL